MTTLSKRFAVFALAFLGSVGCQDVQPDSTLEAPIEQTDMNPSATTDTGGETEPTVRLDAVDRSRPQVSLQPRNPFRFGGAPPITPSGGDLAPPPLDDAPPSLFPSVEEVVPRVQLRMIGLVEASEPTGRIAVLTDGDVVFHGREGEIVEGRYRIVSVGPVSVEIESVVDGRREVLRLSGS